MDRCRLCGDLKPLTPTGVCRWTAGCEHRRHQAKAADDAFDADYRAWFEPQPCGHTGAEHAEQWAAAVESTQERMARILDHFDPEAAEIREAMRRFMEDYGPDPG